MTVHRVRCAILAGLLAATVGLVPFAPALAGPSADRVQDWLNRTSMSLAVAGYRLSWGAMSTSLFGGDVTVRDLRGTDQQGLERLRIGVMTVEEPTTGADGSLTAVALSIGDVTVGGPHAYTVGRIDIAQPDLGAIGQQLERYVVQTGPTNRFPWSRRLTVERMEIRDLKGVFVSDDGPLDIRFDRLLAVGADTGRIQHLEIDGAWQSATGPDGELVTTSMAELRADDLTIAPAVYDMSDDPDTARPFAALAGVGIGRFEIEGFRAESSLTGTSSVDRMWFRTKSTRPGRAGVLSFGSDGMRSQAKDIPNRFAPLLQALFPPDGEVPMQWTGDIAYDVDAGFVGYRQEMSVEDFGSFNLQVDLSGLPDLSIGEWRDAKKGDPRLAALQINGISLSLTDSGGIDRAVLAFAADRTVPAGRLRGAVAEQIGVFLKDMSPSADPRLLRWLAVVQEFVHLGGTLAIGMTKPIPVGDVREQPVKVRDLGELAARYGLAVVRR
ncbi:MAG: hypothetical protein RLO51_18540 [Thalassobaculum sp.]|uniref:hypothetical protein n=1 Tax=Thalassobaculum sp. TaxID=2022740 RepID=UPI0032EC24D5